MSLKAQLNAWLTTATGLQTYWLERPSTAENAIVYRCITPGQVEGNLASPGIKRDVYSITLYHSNPDEGDRLINLIKTGLEALARVDFALKLGEYPLQSVSFNGGFEQVLSGEVGQKQYQFNRDFTFYH